MSLPLFRSPGAVMFLDDDVDFLEMMALVIPPNWPTSLHVRPTECIAQLRQEQTRREADNWRQQEIVDRWRKYCAPLIPQILRYWSSESARYSLAQVCVVDYSMPAMDGLQVLKTLGDWPGTRVLLTGQADEQIAVNAFNDGLIQQFIPKQSPDMAKRLLAAIKRLSSQASSRTTHVWRSTMTPRQHALLSYPSVARDLAQWIDKHWVEYVVIGSPFGVLGRDAAGQTGWLQLEPASGLEELAELAEASVTAHGALAEIRQGRQLVDLDLRQALGRSTPPDMQAAFPIGSDEPLLAAHFPIGAEANDEESSYQSFLAKLPPRKLKA